MWVGSESHPYAVKPTSTIVAEAIGATPHTQAADWEFACKAGSEAIQAAIGFVGSGMARYALAIGMDTAQGRPGDALEYTAAAGGAAFSLGPAEESLAVFEGSFSYVTDTPDFWRRAYEHYPSHGDRFTGEPAYFQHTSVAAQGVDGGAGRHSRPITPTPSFTSPTSSSRRAAAKELGFTREQIETGLLANDDRQHLRRLVADRADGGAGRGRSRATGLCWSRYGSGAGSDAISLRVTDAIPERQGTRPTTRDYIARRVEIDYATYVRFTRKLNK